MRRLGDLLIPVYDLHRCIFAKVVADRGTGLNCAAMVRCVNVDLRRKLPIYALTPVVIGYVRQETLKHDDDETLVCETEYGRPILEVR
jgi:hypothetical protein